MDLRLLEAFRAVVSNHSVTRAARVLGLTQPAVSAQLARLEAAVGFQLFLRSGGRLSLTREGEEFHREVMHALGMYERPRPSSEVGPAYWFAKFTMARAESYYAPAVQNK